MTIPSTLEELAERLEAARTPADVFGDAVDGLYRRFVKLCHPDRVPGPQQKRAKAVFQRLTVWFERARRESTPRFAASPARRYGPLTLFGTGDVADVYRATADGTRYVLKIARSGDCNTLLAAEARRLKQLRERSGTGRYAAYVPELIETFLLADPAGRVRANVFREVDGFHTLETVRRKYPRGLAAHHLAWIFKRLLTAAGFAQASGVVHGAILPPHVLVHPENHGLMLVDWIHATSLGGRLKFVPTKYRSWYPEQLLAEKVAGPADDLFLAARCIRYLAGVEPTADRWPDSMPRPLARFFDTCLFAAPRMRPQNAWDLHAEFDELLPRLFGPRKYHRLVMT